MPKPTITEPKKAREKGMLTSALLGKIVSLFVSSMGICLLMGRMMRDPENSEHETPKGTLGIVLLLMGIVGYVAFSQS